MGNRAVITTKKKDLGVYLHWNGGRDSVEAFLTYCKLKGYCRPENDGYGWARLCQVIGNFFGGDLSLGIYPFWPMSDNNGVYIIEDWQIVGRECFEGFEQKHHPLKDMLLGIDEAQPESERLGEKAILEYLAGLEVKE